MTTQFIINHLWQSSCFVLVAGLLAFGLRKNSPKVRYWVWLSASLKFPFCRILAKRAKEVAYVKYRRRVVNHWGGGPRALENFANPGPGRDPAAPDLAS
jgi:hypothetical protein